MPDQETPHPSDEQIENLPDTEKTRLTSGSFVRNIFGKLWHEKFGSSFALLRTYLKTTAYVLFHPSILIDDIEDEGLDDHVSYSMATFSVTAIVLVIFSILGVESHDSSIQVTIQDQCENCKDFDALVGTDSVYVGNLKDGKPHGAGLLYILGPDGEGSFDSTIVSNFMDGYMVGTAFKYGSSYDIDAIDQLYDGEEDTGYQKVMPFVALLAHLLGLFIYINIFRLFKGVYKDMPDSFIIKGAIFHFNAMFFLFVLLIMIASLFTELPEPGLYIFLLFFGHPLYYFLRLGKIRLRRVISLVILVLVTGIYSMFWSMLLAIFMFGSSVTDKV